MIAFFIVSLLVILAYVGGIVWRYGVPASISESYYLLPKNLGKPLFYGFCVLTALPLMIYWFDITKDQPDQFLVFLACVPLAFVGVSGAFKEGGPTARMHFLSASLCAVFSQIWIALHGWFWIGSVALLVIALVLSRLLTGVDHTGRRVSPWLFFVEIAAFLAIYIAVLFN